MGKVIAGAAAVLVVVFGIKALGSRSHAPGPENPPPEPTDLIPLGSEAGVPV